MRKPDFLTPLRAAFWPFTSHVGAQRNALAASSALARHRREREDVEQYLREFSRAQPGPIVSGALHVPAPRRTAKAVLLLVIRDALDPSWGPLAAGQRAVDHAHGDLRVLRVARGYLLAGEPHEGIRRARALAALCTAIAALEEQTEVGIGQGAPAAGAGSLAAPPA